MSFPEALGLIILGFTLGAQIRLRSFLLSHRARIAWIAAGIIFAAASLITYSQYSLWHDDPVSRFLLPPHQGIGYFAHYAWTRFFAPWCVSAAAGIIVCYIARRMNTRFDGRFFEEEEPFLFGFAVAATGYPTLVFYILLMFAVGLLWSLGYATLKKGRAPLYYLWLPTAIFAILFVHFALNSQYIKTLTF